MSVPPQRLLQSLQFSPSHQLICTTDLHNDLPSGAAFLDIRKRLLRLIEQKYLVDHRPDGPRLLEKLADLCELATVGMHEQE